MKVPFVDLAKQYELIKNEIDQGICAVIRSSCFVGGKFVSSYEDNFKKYIGTKHCIGVGNGTDALEIALAACGVGPGDVVAVPAFTFAATIEAVVRAGATPLLVDIVDSDFGIDVHAVAEHLRNGGEVKAVIPVHLYGHPADMEGLLELRKQFGLIIVEDAAQAHGARCQIGGERKRVGSLGDAACFSFYPTKNLGAAGDGASSWTIPGSRCQPTNSNWSPTRPCRRIRSTEGP